MSGGNHIRAVGQEAAQGASETPEKSGEERVETHSEAEAFELEDQYVDDADDGHYSDDYEAAPSRFGWVLPALAITAIIAWTAAYGWSIRDELLAISSAEVSDWTRWIIDWSIPVLLVGVAWLVAMRNSRAEASRFAATASLLSQESAQLEHRLTVVNRELSLAREFLASQSRELDSLGRMASERISAHADELQNLIRDNGAQVDAIGKTSETALGNMNRLRDDLPVVANSARDVSNQVANAGRSAHEQLEKLIAGFERLNQFGSASENQVKALGKRVDQTLTGFEAQLSQIEGIVAGRFEALQQQASEYRDDISDTETAALAAMNERIVALQEETQAVAARLRDAENDAMEQLRASKDRFQEDVAQTVQTLDQLDKQAAGAAQDRIKKISEEAGRFDDALARRDAKFSEEMERRQAAFETREAQASEVLAQRLADLDEVVAERREAQTAETAKLVEHSQSMSTQLDELSELISQINEQGNATRSSLNDGLDALGAQLAQKQAALAETEKQITELTEAGIRLLEIIQSGARHSREDLPTAIEAASNELRLVEERANALNGLMLSTSQHGSDLSDYLTKTQGDIEETDASIIALQAKLSAQSEDTLAKLQGLRSGFARLAEEGHALGHDTQDTLREALATLEQATASAFAALDEGAREKIGTLAKDVSSEAVQALERSLRNESAETIGKLEQAAAHASGVGREATIQLRDQLSKVNELTGNLEQRVARARELAEEQVNNDFARRMALITDSLNSNAIDISAALAHDVTDTAWDAYLKGDRGIFTRRAVRLIGKGEAREIADLYQQDDAFRANVSRYIHDFEKMLRSMLSTRDGDALSVTVLGSDMGKLYVLLAQAIERFRK